MHTFFAVIEQAGIQQRHLATLMGYASSQITRTRKGERRVTPEFARRATEAIEKIGLRKEDGTVFTESDLFASKVVDVLTTTDEYLTKQGRAA